MLRAPQLTARATSEVPLLLCPVDDRGVEGVGEAREAIAPRPAVEKYLLPGIGTARREVHVRWSHKRRVVLGPAPDLEGLGAVQVHLVELGDGQVVEVQPARRPVPGDVETAIVTQQHALGTLGVDPDVVHVQVHAAALMVMEALHVLAAPYEGLASILGDQQKQATQIDLIGIVRRDAHIAEVPTHVGGYGILMGLVPRVAPIVGAEQEPLHSTATAALGRVIDDKGVDNAWLGDRGVHGHATHALPIGKPTAKPGPGITAVRAAMDTAPRTAASLPGGCPKARGIAGVHHQIDDAHALTNMKYALPTRTAILAAVDAAFTRGIVPRPDGRHVHQVGVSRVSHDLADVGTVVQAHVVPRVATIGGLEHAGPFIGRAAQVRLARSHPDQLGSGAGHLDVAHGVGGLLGEDRLPAQAAVGRLEHTSRSHSRVDRARAPGRTVHGLDAAAAELRAQGLPLQFLEG